MKKLYAIRLIIVHGDLQKAQKEFTKLYNKGDLNMSGFEGATEWLENIVKELWLTLLEINWEPSGSSERIVTYLTKPG